MNFEERSRYYVWLQLWHSIIFGLIVISVGFLVVWLVIGSLTKVLPGFDPTSVQSWSLRFAEWRSIEWGGIWDSDLGEAALRNGILLLSSGVSIFCLIVFWRRMAVRAWTDFWKSAVKQFVPVQRDKLRLSRGPEMSAMSRQISEAEPFEYPLQLSREKRLFLRGQTIDILPIFQKMFVEKSRSLFVFSRFVRFLLLSTITLLVAAAMLASVGGGSVDLYGYLVGGALLIGCAFMVNSAASLFRSILDRNLLLALNSQSTRESEVRERESDQPISLAVSAQSLSRHIRSKLKSQGVFGHARVSETQKEDGSRSVRDTGDFEISMLVEEDYQETRNPFEKISIRRLRFGFILSLFGSVLLLILVTPAITSLLLSPLDQVGLRYLLSPIVLATAFPVARYLSELGYELRSEGRMIFLSDWVETTVTYADFHGDVRSKTIKQMNADGMHGAEEKGQVCSTSYSSVSATVSFASETADPSSERYPFAYYAEQGHDDRNDAVEKALREIERFGHLPQGEVKNRLISEEPELRVIDIAEPDEGNDGAVG